MKSRERYLLPSEEAALERRRAITRKWRAANIEKARELSRDYMRRTYTDPEVRKKRLETSARYQAENEKTLKQYRRRDKLLRKYGLTMEQYQSMFDAQKGVCAVCHRRSTRTNLHVDHNHTTGKVRGLLCHHCNLALGLIEARVNLPMLIFYITKYN